VSNPTLTEWNGTMKALLLNGHPAGSWWDPRPELHFPPTESDGQYAHLHLPSAFEESTPTREFVILAVHPLDSAFPAPEGTLSAREWVARRAAMASHPSGSKGIPTFCGECGSIHGAPVATWQDMTNV
jgi:hypothetical protein